MKKFVKKFPMEIINIVALRIYDRGGGGDGDDDGDDDAQ